MKSWKTTLLGLIAGGLNLYAGGMNLKNTLLSLGLAALGVAAKDSGVTGGSLRE